MGKIQINGFFCERCNHIWAPRGKQKNNMPIVCPKCKSPYWNIKKEEKR